MNPAVLIREFQRQNVLHFEADKVVVPAADGSLIVGRYVHENKCKFAFSRTLNWDALSPAYVASPQYLVAMEHLTAQLMPAMKEGPSPVRLIPTINMTNGVWTNGDVQSIETDVVKPTSTRSFNITEMCAMSDAETKDPSASVPMHNVSCTNRDIEIVDAVIDGTDDRLSDTLIAGSGECTQTELKKRKTCTITTTTLHPRAQDDVGRGSGESHLTISEENEQNRSKSLDIDRVAPLPPASSSVPVRMNVALDSPYSSDPTAISETALQEEASQETFKFGEIADKNSAYEQLDAIVDAFMPTYKTSEE